MRLRARITLPKAWGDSGTPICLSAPSYYLNKALGPFADVREPRPGPRDPVLALLDDQVDVEMTLTSPACPVGPEMLRNAVTALEKVEGVTKANVKLVMSPPWSPEKMSDAARDELGIF